MPAAELEILQMVEISLSADRLLNRYSHAGKLKEVTASGLVTTGLGVKPKQGDKGREVHRRTESSFGGSSQDNFSRPSGKECC